MPLRYKHCIGVQAAQSRSKASKASPGTHTQLEAQSQGDFKTAGRNSTQIKSPFISAFFGFIE